MTMNLQQATRWRQLLGKACMLCCLLAFLAVLDGIIAKFREPVHIFHVLPGEAVEVNGPIPETIKSTTELTFVSEVPELTVAFETIHSGYFLGGNMWRGRLLAGDSLPPGNYTVVVKPKHYPDDKPGYRLEVLVYPDPLSQRAAAKSVLKSRTGVSPFLVAATFLPFMGIFGGMVFLLSQRIAILQAAQGVAEIYQVKRGDGDYFITFGLGQKHGLTMGDRVSLLDPEGKLVGTAQVEEVSEEDAVARTSADQAIKPGYFVSRS